MLITIFAPCMTCWHRNRINGRRLGTARPFPLWRGPQSSSIDQYSEKAPRTSGINYNRGDAQIGGYPPLPVKKIGCRNGGVCPVVGALLVDKTAMHCESPPRPTRKTKRTTHARRPSDWVNIACRRTSVGRLIASEQRVPVARKHWNVEVADYSSSQLSIIASVSFHSVF
jgi:hypothetical protein